MDKIQNPKGQSVDPSKPFTVGLQWDQLPNTEIDLDLQCIQLNELGQIEDAVYFNQLESKISKIKLSEDSAGEKQGFDEALTIDLNSCPFQVKYLILMICSYKEQPFSYVESSQFSILQNNTSIFETSIGAFGHGGSLSLLPCIFERAYDGTWSIFRVEEVGKGKTFLDNEQLIKKGLIKVGFDQILFEECKNWKGDKSFKMEKNKSLIIPKSLDKIFVGLGWDTRCDIDSSILLFNSKNKCEENIYFGNKNSKNDSIRHHGDNLSGDSTGDDEVISIHLNQVQQDIKSIWAVITIYSSSYQFDDVKGAYCRLFSSETKSEFCKYNLSQNKDGVSTGNIMCCITRCQEGTWCVSPKGFYTKDTNSSRQVISIIENILVNNFSEVKTIDQIYPNQQYLQWSQPEVKPQVQQQVYTPPPPPPPPPQTQAPVVQKITTCSFTVEVVSASGLAAFDSNGFSDPYVIIKLNGKKISTTPIIKKNLNPVWNFSKQFVIGVNDKLEFKIFDHDTMAFDDYIGSAYHDLVQQNIDDNSTTLNLSILDKDRHQNHKFTGTLLVKLTPHKY